MMRNRFSNKTLCEHVQLRSHCGDGAPKDWETGDDRPCIKMQTGRNPLITEALISLDFQEKYIPSVLKR